MRMTNDQKTSNTRLSIKTSWRLNELLIYFLVNKNISLHINCNNIKNDNLAPVRAICNRLLIIFTSSLDSQVNGIFVAHTKPFNATSNEATLKLCIIYCRYPLHGVGGE